jgi:hypothetical protein
MENWAENIKLLKEKLKSGNLSNDEIIKLQLLIHQAIEQKPTNFNLYILLGYVSLLRPCNFFLDKVFKM